MKRDTDWYRWFAWHPARISANRCAWLTTVERRGEWKWGGGCHEWVWEYREVTGE